MKTKQTAAGYLLRLTPEAVQQIADLKRSPSMLNSIVPSTRLLIHRAIAELHKKHIGGKK